ncbi:EAL domain-containing protein [Candidatus Marinimicrobia bacterium]|nr:EAL domain-containing protein [Candidatus Neomarinimicrobiota bacterium]
MQINFKDYKSIVDNLHEGIIIFNKKYEIKFCNNFFSNLFEFETNKTINSSLIDIIDKRYVELFKNHLKYNFEKSIDLQLITKSNKTKYIRFSFNKHEFDNKEHTLAMIEDITQMRHEEVKKMCIYKISEAIHASDNLSTLYIEIHTILSDITNVTNFYIALVDWDTESITFPYFIDEKDEKPLSYQMKKGLTEYVINSGESLLLNKEIYDNLILSKNIEPIGTPCYNWLGVPLKLLNGKTIGMICVQNYKNNYLFKEEDMKILQYVSDQIAMAIKRKVDDIKIHKQAHYDDLTGLTNKALFYDRLEHAIHSANRKDELIAVLFIDLDNFKYVNDSMGHDVGDKLLKIIANKLSDSVRKGDTVSRWGGDEFTILTPNVKRISGIFKLCERILNENFRNIIIEGQELHITGSIGIALYPQDGDTADILIKNADAAMYKSKELGKNQFHLYKPKLNVDIMERLDFESGLFKAIKNEEFSLVYQPQLSLSTDSIIGFEALVRWNKPDKGVLAPYKFIPIAEETNLIIPLGEWIIKQVCLQAKKWHDMGYNLTSGINISGKQFNQPQIVKIIKNCIYETGVNPKFIELELTESVIMKDVDRTIDVFNQFKDMGISISIDDFGTGYSSLSYLKEFPIDKLKIDQSFISNITDPDSNEGEIANLVIDLGHKLGLEVIAEGVETKQQIEFLKKYACDQIQGFILSKPLPIDKFEELLKKRY